MRKELLTRWLGPLVLAALLPLGVAACSKAEQDHAEQSTDTLADQAREAGGQIGQTLDSLGDDARRMVEQAGEDLRNNSQDVREAAVRNGVAAVAGGEFQRHGVELAGTPDCAATSPSIGQYHVECTGQTKDGKPVTLVGDDPGDPPSNFVGSVDGQEVFRQQCVGLC
jgi:hypothetical protein